MTRKFYEEPQILVMEMDEEEIIATSEKVNDAVTMEQMTTDNNANANVSSWGIDDTKYTFGN